MADDVANPTVVQLEVQAALLRQRIARWLLWVGVCEMLLCGLGLYVLHKLHHTSIPELVESADPAIRESLAVRLTEAQQLALPIAVIVMLLGVLPGLAYIVLGPAIRRGAKSMAMAAQVVLMLQIIILAGEIAVSLYNAIAAGSPGQFSMRVVFVGTFVAVLVFIVQRLMELRQYEAALAHRKGQPGND